VNHCGHNAVRDVIDVRKRPRLLAGPGRSAVDFTSVALSNTIDETWTSSMPSLRAAPKNGAVEAGVQLEERVWKLVKVLRDAADDRGRVNYVSASVSCRPSLARRAEVTGADLARIVHPSRCLALIGHSQIPGGITRKYAHDGAADCAGSASDEHAPH
jgi:hypothetical protein